MIRSASELSRSRLSFACLVAVVTSLFLTSSAAAFKHMYVSDPFGNGSAHPRTLLLSADADFVATKLRWHGWGGKTSRARATFVFRTTPSQHIRRPGTLILGQPKSLCDGGIYYYARARFRVRHSPFGRSTGSQLLAAPTANISCRRAREQRELAAHGKTFIMIGESLTEPGPTHLFRRPRGFRLTSEDSSIRFSHLHWRHWGGKRAIGRGRAKTCGSGGVEGYVCHSGRVKLVASNRITCGPDYFYEHLIAHGVPEYGDRLEVPRGGVEC